MRHAGIDGERCRDAVRSRLLLELLVLRQEEFVAAGLDEDRREPR